MAYWAAEASNGMSGGPESADPAIPRIKGEIKENHVLQQSWPQFLSLLDAQPATAERELYVFVKKFFAACPPSKFRLVTAEDRDDVVDEIYLHCSRDRFRKLRLYTDVGKPFAAWFNRVADNWIADWLTAHRHTQEVEGSGRPRVHGRLVPELRDPGPRPEDVISDRQILDIVLGCYQKLGVTCRILIQGTLEGRAPRELVVLLGWDADRNKEVSDRLRHCRRKLVKYVTESGVDINAHFGRRET